MSRMPGVPFIRPRSWSSGRPNGPPRFVVIHYTAGSEGPTAAEDGVAYDQRRTDGTSAHFYTDRDTIIQCVDTADRSHTALWSGNQWGIHIEQCGTAQTRAQWLDAASRATIRNTAKVVAWALTTHGLPLSRLVTSQVRTGKGICGHKDITLGYPEDGGSHMDPDGSIAGSYPYDVLFEDVKALLTPAPPPPPPEVDVEETTLIHQPANIIYPDGNKAFHPPLNYMLHFIASTGSYARVEQRAGDAADKVRDDASAVAITALTTLVNNLSAAVSGVAGQIETGGGNVDAVAILAKIEEQSEATRVEIRAQAQAELAEQRQAWEAAAAALAPAPVDG